MLILDLIVGKTGQSDSLWSMGWASFPWGSWLHGERSRTWMKLKFCWEERSGCFLFFLFLNTKPTASITEAAMGKWDVNTIMKTNFSFFVCSNSHWLSYTYETHYIRKPIVQWSFYHFFIKILCSGQAYQPPDPRTHPVFSHFLAFPSLWKITPWSLPPSNN